MPFDKNDKPRDKQNEHLGIGNARTYCLINENEIIPICMSFLEGNDADKSSKPLMSTSFDNVHVPSKVQDAHEEGSMLWRGVGEYFKTNKKQGQNPNHNPKPKALSNYKLVLHDGVIITPSPDIALSYDPVGAKVGIRLTPFDDQQREDKKTEFWWTVTNEDYSTSKDERSFLEQITECFSQTPPTTKELWVAHIYVIGFARQGLALAIDSEKYFLSWEFFINVSVLFDFKNHSGEEVKGLNLKLSLNCIGISYSACTFVENQCDLRKLKPILSQFIDKIEIEQNQVYNIRTLMPAVPELKLIYSCSPISGKPSAFKCFCKNCLKRIKGLSTDAGSNDFNHYSLFTDVHKVGNNAGSFAGDKEMTFVLQRLQAHLASIHGQRQTLSSLVSQYCNKIDGSLINDSFDKNKGVVNIVMSSALRWSVFHNPIDPNYLDPLIYHERTIHQHLNKYFTYLGPIVIHRYMKSPFLRKSKLLFDFLEETKPIAKTIDDKPNGEKPIGAKSIDADSPFETWSKKKASNFSIREIQVQSNYVMTRVEEHFEAVRDVFNPSMLQMYDGTTDRFVLYQYFLGKMA